MRLWLGFFGFSATLITAASAAAQDQGYQRQARQILERLVSFRSGRGIGISGRFLRVRRGPSGVQETDRGKGR